MTVLPFPTTPVRRLDVSMRDLGPVSPIRPRSPLPLTGAVIADAPPTGRTLVSGLAGAVTVTLLNEAVRRLDSRAPRLDVLGLRALSRLVPGLRREPRRTGFGWAMLGDLVSNTLFYSLVAAGGTPGVWARGAGRGLAAGAGAVVLPGPLGLGRAPSARTPRTRAMTVAWYLAGDLAAAAVAHALNTVDARDRT